MSNNFMKKEKLQNKFFFKKNGYVLFKNFYSKNFCKEFLKDLELIAPLEFNTIINLHREDFLISQSFNRLSKIKYIKDRILYLNNLKKISKKIEKVIKHKKILNKLEFLYDKKVNPIQSQMIYKKKNSKFSNIAHQPHQDNSYAKNKNGRFFTVHLILKDINKKNGTIYVYPETHKLGDISNDTDLNYAAGSMKPGNKVNLSKSFKKVDIIAKSGDLLVLHGWVVHGSYPNNSKISDRPIFCGMYIPEGEKFIKGRNADRKIF